MKFVFFTAMAGMAYAQLEDLLNDTLGKTLGKGASNSVVDRLEYTFKGPFIKIADDENVELNLFHWVLNGKLFFQNTFKSKKIPFRQLSN